jgi:hypothetical protein
MALPQPHLRMPRKRNTSPSAPFTAALAEAPIWALLVAFGCRSIYIVLRSRARVDEHW